jgi:ditrans,polycis-polyprenyl diphosphate synthase
MSTWFPERPKTWYHRLCTKIIKSGPIPKHVAVIMDGNRRFAMKNSMERAEGHLKGFDKLTEVYTYLPLDKYYCTCVILLLQ